jgi:hypothetical protein
MSSIVWQSISIRGVFRLGKCKPCSVRYAWPADKLRLSDMACPRCGGSLAPTTLLGLQPFIELERSPSGGTRPPQPLAQLRTDHTHTVLASYGHPERVGMQVDCYNPACRPKPERIRNCTKCHQPIQQESIAVGWCADCFGGR